MAISDNDKRIQGCGFAKLVGDNVDFVMKKYSIVMGRKSKNSTNDLILGDLMSLSRQHARIYYNFTSNQFELEVLGKNGVSVNGTPYVPGDPPARLDSKCLIQMGEVSLYFLLPRNPDDIFPPPPPLPAATVAPMVNVQPIPVPNIAVTSPQQQQQQQQLQIDPATLASMLQQNPVLMQTMAAALLHQQQQQQQHQ